MKVLQVIPSIGSETGGPARSTLANCRALYGEAPFIRFTLATTDEGLDTAWQLSIEKRMPPGTRLEVFPGVGRHAFAYSGSLVAWLWRHVSEFDLVVVRALLHPVSSTAAWIARRRGIPYLLVPHGTLSRYTFEHRRTRLKKAYFQLVERRTLAGAAAVRFTSEMERDEAPPWGGSTPVEVIPHPYESRSREAFASSRKANQILFLSRLDPMKGLDLLFQALPSVFEGAPDANVVVAGSGIPRVERWIRSRLRDLGLGSRVELPGFVEGAEKTRLLRESAVFVLPSCRENFGIAVVEAMDAGLPVVISKGVAIWANVEAAGAGIVLEKRTPGLLAAALSKLLRAPDARRNMGAAGVQLVRKAFDPEQVGRRLMRLYERAAESASRRAEVKV